MKKIEEEIGNVVCEDIIAPLDLKSYSDKSIFLLGDSFM